MAKISEFSQHDMEVIAREYADLKEAVRKRCTEAYELDMVQKAFEFANEAHKGVRRRSGEPYILHPIAVAKIVVSNIGLKPFGAAEFLARVRSALRNAKGHVPGKKFELNGLSIDFDSRKVFVRETQIHLTQTEYNIVVLLAQNIGKVMTYSQIIKEVWGYPDDGSIKKLQVNMANIRRKFGEKPGKGSYIINELGVGYRMNDELTDIS